MEETEQPQALPELSDQERLFVEMYLLYNQKSKAARLAGYSEKTARQIGYELYHRPHVRAAISAKITERTITSEETLKLISDTASANLTDYFKPVYRVKHEMVKRTHADLIADKEAEYIRELKFADAKQLTGDPRDEFTRGIQHIQDDIIRLKIELEENPKAFRIVRTEGRLVKENVLDIDALVADKIRGKVKKIKYGRDGIEVEMYSAADAQDRMARIHGLYEKDNTQSRPVLAEKIEVEIIPPQKDE